MSLLSLPPEILDKICKDFCTHCQTAPLSHFPHKETLTTSCSGQIWGNDTECVKALVNLSETCKALSTFTLPHRYHRIELKSGILYNEEFLAHIRGRVHNALNHVRSLSLAYTEAKDACTSFNVVLRIVPKIQLLHIRLGLKHKIKVSRQTTLESLRYLHIECSDNESNYLPRLQIYELLRQAPKIDTLVIQVATLSWSFISGGLRNVKCLTLVDTLVSARFLESFLDACPQLESFILSHSASEGIWSTFDYATPKTLPRVLSVRQETLRYLEIYWNPRPVGEGGIEIVGSFKGLTNLEALILGGSGLRFEKAENKKTVKTCLVDLLPQSIRSVSIDSDYMSLHEPIFALGDAVKQGSFPMLKEVRCYNWLYGHLMGLVLEKASTSSSITPEDIQDCFETSRSSRRLLSQLSRTCNVSFSATPPGLFERVARRRERS